MRGDRATGATLYALALALLLAGGVWFGWAAPATGEDPQLRSGRATVERLLPDVPQQGSAETMIIAGGARTDRTTTVPGGAYVVTMVCAGDGQVRVRLSVTGEDSGRAVPCAAEDPEPVELAVGLADEFFMAISAEAQGPVVFRWRITPARSY